jgi:hypothetical protein
VRALWAGACKPPEPIEDRLQHQAELFLAIDDVIQQSGVELA